jgi:hypothetical protein
MGPPNPLKPRRPRALPSLDHVSSGSVRSELRRRAAYSPRAFSANSRGRNLSNEPHARFELAINVKATQALSGRFHRLFWLKQDEVFKAETDMESARECLSNQSVARELWRALLEPQSNFTTLE